MYSAGGVSVGPTHLIMSTGAEGQAHLQVQPSFLPGVTLRSAWLSLWKLALEIPGLKTPC